MHAAFAGQELYWSETGTGFGVGRSMPGLMPESKKLAVRLR